MSGTMADASDNRPPLLSEAERSVTPVSDERPEFPRELTRVSTVESPHSFSNEVRYFCRIGVPLTLSALFSGGLPSIVGMVFAGHTENSAFLQAAVGYGRVWYNCTAQMAAVSMLQYANTMLPSCIGAGRPDQIGACLRRGLLLSVLCMLPLYALQFVSSPILQCLGIPANIAFEVQKFSRIMILTNLVWLYNQHMISLVINLGYARLTTVVSLFGGLLQVLSAYTFVYKLGWEMVGQAIAGLSAELGRTLILNIVILVFGLWRQRSRTDGVVVSPEDENRVEPLLSWKDCQVFVSLMVPSLLTNFAGWLIFEFQMVALANIRGIPHDALAAGAAWVTLEGFMAASQQGFIQCLQMRIVTLLGKGDPGARSAFWQLSLLSAAVVGVCNLFFMAARRTVCEMVSNDTRVQDWLEQLFWVLIIHTQSRIGSCGSAQVFIPVGRGKFQTGLTFVSFYCIAAPIAALVALTDIAHASIATKMLACVGLTSIAQSLQCVAFYGSLHQMDWKKAAAIVSGRVKCDTQGGSAQHLEAGESRDADLSGAS